MRLSSVRSCCDIEHTFRAVLSELFNHGTRSAPRGMAIIELINCTIIVSDPTHCLLIHPSRQTSKKYVAAEILWYLSGSKSVDEIGQYAEMWKKVADDDGNVNSNYGDLIFNPHILRSSESLSQFEWCRRTLEYDIDSRQAVLNLNLLEHKVRETKDFPCTLSLQFIVRENKLHMITNMRSNDFIFGFMNDFPFFSFVQQTMHSALLHCYPTLELGKYIHNAASLHIYERHYKLMGDVVASSNTGVGGTSEGFDKINAHDVLLFLLKGEQRGIIQQLHDWKYGKELSI